MQQRTSVCGLVMVRFIIAARGKGINQLRFPKNIFKWLSLRTVTLLLPETWDTFAKATYTLIVNIYAYLKAKL